MKKFLIILLSLVVSAASAFAYFFVWKNRDYSSDEIVQEELFELPKSLYFKVTSTAKGHNQSKLARLGDDVFTFYLDNEPTDGVDNEDSNNKNMVLIRIKADGTYEEFDSIPVWMHGNVLINQNNGNIYFTTYEITNNGVKKASIHLYTYQLVDDVPTRIDSYLVEEDTTYYCEDANPRVGADIDEQGNIAITYGIYSGSMKTHVYDAVNQIWIKHVVQHITPGVDDNDSNLYPFVRINGINDIRIIANQDANINGALWRKYERYFYYNGTTWIHRIISDVREYEATTSNKLSVRDTDLYVDAAGNNHIIVYEDKGNSASGYREIIITPSGEETEKSLAAFSMQMLRNFIKIIEVGGQKYYVSTGTTMDIFHGGQTGYLEIYNYDTLKLVKRLKGVSRSPYLYLAKSDSNNFLDIMIISRDKDYDVNSETFYLRLKKV